MICVKLATASETGFSDVYYTHMYYSRFGLSDVRRYKACQDTTARDTVVLPLRTNRTHNVYSLLTQQRCMWTIMNNSLMGHRVYVIRYKCKTRKLYSRRDNRAMHPIL